MSRYKIMTFDGGGIRGALTIRLLLKLLKKFPKLVEETDLFAGTSTGAFIALGLANGMDPEKLAKLYSEKNGRYIFTPEYFSAFRPKYDNKHLKKLLHSIFPENLALKDLNTHVVIPSFRVIDSLKIQNFSPGSWYPVFFNNFPNSNTADNCVIDVALASSAAPVFFPSYKDYIDGGVIANNPSTTAISFAVSRSGGKQDLEDLSLLSIGTGFSPHRIKENTRKWGALQWFLNFDPPVPLINIMTDGVAQADKMLSHQLLNKRYFRLNPVLPYPIELYDYEKVIELKSIANKTDLSQVFKWLRTHW
jgi:patatin-like phospholipase/acyl hydrolase